MTKPPREDPTPYRALGQRIAELRERINISQREMARRAHISESYPSPIERGQHRPDTDVLMQLARVLDADYNELATLAGYNVQRQGEPIIVRPTNALRLRRLDRFPSWLLDQLDEFGQSMLDRLDRLGNSIFYEQQEPENRPGVRADEEGNEQQEPDDPDTETLNRD